MSDDDAVQGGLHCPGCGKHASNLYAPRFHPQRWWRRAAFWQCTHCKYRWTDWEASE